MPLSISRPAALRGVTDAQLFNVRQEDVSNGSSLRLIRGLARIAGGDLVTSPAGFTLVFPAPDLARRGGAGYLPPTVEGL